MNLHLLLSFYHTYRHLMEFYCVTTRLKSFKSHHIFVLVHSNFTAMYIHDHLIIIKMNLSIFGISIPTSCFLLVLCSDRTQNRYREVISHHSLVDARNSVYWRFLLPHFINIRVPVSFNEHKQCFAIKVFIRFNFLFKCLCQFLYSLTWLSIEKYKILLVNYYFLLIAPPESCSMTRFYFCNLRWNLLLFLDNFLTRYYWEQRTD